MSKTVDEFHRLYYDCRRHQWERWQGIPIAKCPLDMHVYQEIIFERRPELIIETGTWNGGSAVFLRDMLRLVGGGQVLTIDISRPPTLFEGVLYATGTSTKEHIVAQARQLARGKETMVILDSDHTRRHVLKELDAYAPLVSKRQYLIVEDGNANGHPILPRYGPGPTEALERWLPDHPEFRVDSKREKFLLTFNPGGYLERI